MTSDTRPDPFFIADSTALDFLNTIATPRTTEYEWLATGSDLVDWLLASHLLSETEGNCIRNTTSTEELDTAAKNIRAFREEFRTFITAASLAKAAPAQHEIISKINELISGLEQSTRLLQCSDESGLQLKTVYAVKSAEDLLPRIALACAELISQADFKTVRNCEGPTCSLYFRDVSKNGKRRWCSMEVCGNRAKAAAFRKRR